MRSRCIEINTVVDLDDVIDEVAKHYDPEDVFSDSQLADWAERNGYVEKSND